MTIRASSLPLVALCPEAAELPTVRMADGSPEATLGTAAHEAILGFVRDGNYDLNLTADRYGIEFEDLRPLFWAGQHIWDKIEANFPAPLVEFEMRQPELVGHIDIHSIVGNQVRILDLKTGRADEEHEQQLLGYSWLAMQAYPEIESAYYAIAWVRSQEIEGYPVRSREYVSNWWKRLSSEKGFRPGRHCGHCRRGHECAAKTALVAQAANALTVPTMPPATSAQAWAALYDRTKLLGGVIEVANEMIRAHVEAAGGEYDLGDGRKLVFVEQQRKTINYAAGEELLREALGDVLPSLVTISKTEVEKAVKASMPRGLKGPAVTGLMERLDQAGAITVSSFQRLECKRNGNTDADRIAGSNAIAGD